MSLFLVASHVETLLIKTSVYVGHPEGELNLMGMALALFTHIGLRTASQSSATLR